MRYGWLFSMVFVFHVTYSLNVQFFQNDEIQTIIPISAEKTSSMSRYD